jgi:uncharacterized protein YdgA (DUF945 family)
VRKGIVALLVVLAIVVLVSPGIVGRLAEKSMDKNLDWAATESQEVAVTSRVYDRGWFSSEGQHRVEIREGELQNLLLALAGSEDANKLPSLIIDTRLDHGLIPLASMSRDRGTLIPGLGSAISTVSVELADGETAQLPGTIYSDVGLTGELSSRLVLEAGEHDFGAAASQWGDTSIEVTTDPASGDIWFDGMVDSFSLAAEGDYFGVGKIEFSGKQRQSPFGFSVGDIDVVMQTMTVETPGETLSFGPLAIGSTSDVSGDRVSGRTVIRLDNTPFGDLGAAAIAADVADGAALGYIKDALDNLQGGGSMDEFMFVVENDLQRLLASGFELRVDQLDISLPQGPITSKFRFVVTETDANAFTWSSALLALDATADISISAELLELMISKDPQVNAVVAMGFLRKDGDVYVMEAAFQKGLLTVNGAPMPIPLSGLE